MLQDIALPELIQLRNKHEFVLVDVRSPSEYRDSTIPGSLNIPLFDDQERAEIGTIYKQVSVQAAKERGLEIVSAKLPAFVKQFAELPRKKAVFCWRGGMRSKTTATLLSLMGIQAYRLAGGYRAYRRWIVDQLEPIAASFSPKPYMINGYTGSGKTEILRRLAALGHPVLDFEAMAGHRGSIFGHIGLQAHNQKTFDALLIEELIRLEAVPYVLFEAESKRIGKVVLPDPIVQIKSKAQQIWLDIPLKSRVQQILDNYRPWECIEEFMTAFHKIKSRIHTPIAAEIEQRLTEEDYERTVELLLTHYYDPRYAHTISEYGQDPIKIIQANNVQEAVERLDHFVRSEQCT